MMAMKTPDSVESAWELYQEACVPADAGEGQHRDTRWAFYAGAWYILQLMHRLGENDVSEDQGVSIIARTHDEVQAWYRRGGRD